MATFTEWSLGNSPSLGLVLKKNRPEKFPLITTNNRFALAVQWSVKNIFAPNSPIFRKNYGEEEDGENQQMHNVLLFKQTQ